LKRYTFAESANPTIRDLAGRIVDDQTSEIEQMRGWLEDWYPGARRAPDPVVTRKETGYYLLTPDECWRRI
jgi:Domain of unknown function (DUF305)